MIGVLHLTPEQLALQWFFDRILSGATSPVIDLTAVEPVSCPTCGHVEAKELEHVS